MKATEVFLEPAEALAIAGPLWDVAYDPSTHHDLKVEAIHHAGFLELDAGLPAAPTHSETTDEVVQYFEKVRMFLQKNVEAIIGGRASVDGTLASWDQAAKVKVRRWSDLVSLLWKCVVDPRSRHRERSAYFACLLQHKAYIQKSYESDDHDLDLYKSVLASLDKHLQELKLLSSEQRKNRPPHWPPAP